ncbi:MAG: hypothetical protein LBF72_02500 [Holosporales bacterium]|jgi:hypothetical protein|nr:hypothetical protein [Holosporales bacterium]
MHLGRLVFSMLPLFLVSCRSENSGLGEKQKEEVKQLVKEAVSSLIEEEPELFVKAVDLGMQKQRQQAAKAVESAATKAQSQLWSSPLVIGNKDAKLKLAVFFDPLDPISQKFRDDVVRPIVKERDDVGFFFIPVSVFTGEDDSGKEGAIPLSLPAAKAIVAACSQDTSKAIVLWEKLSSGAKKEITPTLIQKYAKEVGLDPEKIEKAGDAAQKALIENGKLAVQINIPAQLPVIFVRHPEGTLEIIPAFVKDKMILVLDAVLNGKPWAQVITASMQQEQEKAGD